MKNLSQSGIEPATLRVVAHNVICRYCKFLLQQCCHSEQVGVFRDASDLYCESSGFVSDTKQVLLCFPSVIPGRCLTPGYSAFFHIFSSSFIRLLVLFNVVTPERLRPSLKGM